MALANQKIVFKGGEILGLTLEEAKDKAKELSMKQSVMVRIVTMDSWDFSNLRKIEKGLPPKI